MRILKTPDAAIDPQTLWRELLRQPGAASVTPELITALNADVNFKRNLPANSVLLIPDAADLKADVGTPVGADELDALLGDIEAALEAIVTRANAGFKKADTDRAAITAALKSPVAKRIVDGDPEVKKLLQSANAQFKADQKRARDTQSQLADMQKLASNEFARLRKILDDTAGGSGQT
jgi:hypothetical protein